MEQEKYEVFISYSTKDEKLAQALCNRLEGQGIRCWIAPRDIESGSLWAASIVKGIDKAGIVALLVSEASTTSDQVEKEVNIADGAKKDILPIRIENVTLKGSFRYHLSNKQWVDAFGVDTLSVFDPAVEAIRTKIGRPAEAKVDPAGGLMDLARRIVNDLNNKHQEQLAIMNSMFSVSRRDDDILIFFPIRLGATGIDIIFKFNEKSKKMEVYVDAASFGDPMKWAFILLIKNSCAQEFPHRIEQTQNKRNRVLVLIPETELTTGLAALGTEKCFELFSENLIGFSNRVLPNLLNWVIYSVQVGDALNKLEEALKREFPEEEGWRVGAPENERLTGFRVYGKINVYKENWQPKDNYKTRGLLSITLESGSAFLENLCIGITKYEPWLNLGEWKHRLLEEGDRLAGPSGPPSDWWPWLQYLDEPWKNSGIGSAEPRWKGEDWADRFVSYCIERFRLLKGMETTLQRACEEIPELQIMDPDAIPEEQHQNWYIASLYIQNRMRMMADVIRESTGSGTSENGLEVGYRYRGGWSYNDILIKTKVNSFETAIAFRFHHRSISAEIMNLEPPDFETQIVREFLRKKYPGVLFERKEDFKKDCDGGTVAQWMDRVWTFISGSMEISARGLLAMNEHLKKVVELVCWTGAEIDSILTCEGNWVVENKAVSLEKLEPITIYNKSWLGTWEQPGELPPLVVQISPSAPCFDDLNLVVRFLGTPTPESERVLGKVCGACDFAFGTGQTGESLGLWSRPLDEPFRKTGGSSFDRPLIQGEEREALGKYIRGIVEKIGQMEPILAEACRMENERMTKALIEDFWKELHNKVDQKFAGVGWETELSHGNEGKLDLSRPEWQHLYTVGFGGLHGKTWVGVWCNSNDPRVSDIYPRFGEELKSVDGRLRKDSKFWPGWYYTGTDFSTPLGINSIQPTIRSNILSQYFQMVEDLVEKAVPVIDRFAVMAGE